MLLLLLRWSLGFRCRGDLSCGVYEFAFGASGRELRRFAVFRGKGSEEDRNGLVYSMKRLCSAWIALFWSSDSITADMLISEAPWEIISKLISAAESA